MEEYFYFVGDIMKMLNVKEAKAYQIIRQVNAKLSEDGYMTMGGRVPRQAFKDFFGLSRGEEKKE